MNEELIRRKKEKLRIYLDTNIIFGYFWAKVKVLKGKTNKFIEPRVIEFLRGNRNKWEYFTTTLCKAELTRRLRTELGIEKDEIRKLWTGFKNLLGLKEVKLENTSIEKVWKEVLKVTEEVRLKKRVTNLEHLIAAKELDSYFLTGDKEIIAKCRRFYEKILSYGELKGYLKEELNNIRGTNETERSGKGDNNKQQENESLSSGRKNYERGIREIGRENIKRSYREAGKKAERGCGLNLFEYLTFPKGQTYPLTPAIFLSPFLALPLHFSLSITGFAFTTICSASRKSEAGQSQLLALFVTFLTSGSVVANSTKNGSFGRGKL